MFKNYKIKNSKITCGGQVIILAAFFFLVLSLTMAFGIATPILRIGAAAQALQYGNQSFYAAEGAAQDVSYRLINGLAVDAVETLFYGKFRASATTTALAEGKEIIATGNQGRFARKSQTVLALGSGAAFHYGMQSGEGGIVLENSSSIVGNVLSNGPIEGDGNNLIKGDIISAGPLGLVKEIHATSSAYAHTIQDTLIDKDAFYQTISDSTVLGALHPGSPDQATSSLPISDAQIAEWESDAAAGGVISSPCPYKITSAVTIGPKKIACDMEISGTGYTVTLAGHLWVAGNLTIKNSPFIKVAASLNGTSVALIADNPANRITSSKIASDNSAVFEGSGSLGSYVLLLSQNKSAENGGSETAINVANSARGAFFTYAGHGEILLQNSVSLKEVTAWRIRLKNSAEVIYETGLANLLFSSGPGGGYVMDGWREVE